MIECFCNNQIIHSSYDEQTVYGIASAPNTVGIATVLGAHPKTYCVYRTDENARVIAQTKFANINEALAKAKEWYQEVSQ